MKIIYKESFVNRLENQIAYIAQDNHNAARKFRKELIKRLKDIPNYPNKYRKSIYFDDTSIRDLIYKGYTVVFRINANTIEVFGFVKFQERPYD